MKERILIIEDHKSLRILLDNFLNKNYEVKTVTDGYEALSYLDKGVIPDAIVLDINMPKLGGYDFLKNIRNSGFFQHIPVIIVSSEEDGKVIERCLDLGINGYLKKPFNPNELQSKITTILTTNKKPELR